MARGSGRVRTPDTQPQRLIWTPVMTLGAARTPCLLLAQLNLSKNTRKGPLPPTHQAPRKPTMEVTACPPDPSACSFPSFWRADCPGAPRAHGTGEGGSTCPHIGVSLGLAAGGKAGGGVQAPGPRGTSGRDGEAREAERREQVFIRSLLAAWSWHLLRTRLSPPSTAASLGRLHRPPSGLGGKQAGDPHLAPWKHLPIIRITVELGFLSLGPQVLALNKQVPAPQVPTACFSNTPPAQPWSGSCSLVHPTVLLGHPALGARRPSVFPKLPHSRPGWFSSTPRSLLCCLSCLC